MRKLFSIFWIVSFFVFSVIVPVFAEDIGDDGFLSGDNKPAKTAQGPKQPAPRDPGPNPAGNVSADPNVVKELRVEKLIVNQSTVGRQNVHKQAVRKQKVGSQRVTKQKVDRQYVRKQYVKDSYVKNQQVQQQSVQRQDVQIQNVETSNIKTANIETANINTAYVNNLYAKYFHADKFEYGAGGRTSGKGGHASRAVAGCPDGKCVEGIYVANTTHHNKINGVIDLVCASNPNIKPGLAASKAQVMRDGVHIQVVVYNSDPDPEVFAAAVARAKTLLGNSKYQSVKPEGPYGTTCDYFLHHSQRASN